MNKMFCLLAVLSFGVSFNAHAIDLVSQAQKDQEAVNQVISEAEAKKEQVKAELEQRKAEDARKKAELRRESQEFRQEILDMHENLAE